MILKLQTLRRIVSSSTAGAGCRNCRGLISSSLAEWLPVTEAGTGDYRDRDYRDSPSPHLRRDARQIAISNYPASRQRRGSNQCNNFRTLIGWLGGTLQKQKICTIFRYKIQVHSDLLVLKQHIILITFSTFSFFWILIIYRNRIETNINHLI